MCREITKQLSFKLEHMSHESLQAALSPVPRHQKAEYDSFSVSYNFRHSLGPLYKGAMVSLKLTQDVEPEPAFPDLNREVEYSHRCSSRVESWPAVIAVCMLHMPGCGVVWCWLYCIV